MNAEIPEKAALDVQTDQVRAHLAAMRRRGGEIAVNALLTARHLAAQLRMQFPGRDRDNARALAATASVLSAVDDWLSEHDVRPELIGPVLLDVLGYAAEDLNQDRRNSG